MRGGDKEQLKQLVRDGVSYATELGMYVIVDWHILSDCDPNQNKDEAIAFFREMSEAFADNDNVLYEICNEPNSGTSWDSIKSYAEEVIPVIREQKPGCRHPRRNPYLEPGDRQSRSFPAYL